MSLMTFSTAIPFLERTVLGFATLVPLQIVHKQAETWEILAKGRQSGVRKRTKNVSANRN
jgi:hypothetical protein